MRHSTGGDAERQLVRAAGFGSSWCRCWVQRSVEQHDVRVGELLADRNDPLVLRVVPEGAGGLDVGEPIDDGHWAQFVAFEVLMQANGDRRALVLLNSCWSTVRYSEAR